MFRVPPIRHNFEERGEGFVADSDPGLGFLAWSLNFPRSGTSCGSK